MQSKYSAITLIQEHCTKSCTGNLFPEVIKSQRGDTYTNYNGAIFTALYTCFSPISNAPGLNI